MHQLPEADDIVERFERYMFDFDSTDYANFDLADDLDQCLFDAIKKNDMQSVDKILEAFAMDPARREFRLDGVPVLLLAVVAGRTEMIQRLIEHHKVDVRDCDWSGNTALHMAVWNRRTPYYYNTRWTRNEPTCKGCDLKLHRLDVTEILLKVQDPISAFENIFVDANKNGISPFLRACAAGCDEHISYFLDFLDKMNPKPRFVSNEAFLDEHDNNVFHYILDSSTYFMTGTRSETVQSLIERLPFSRGLLNAGNCIKVRPLEILARADFPVDWTQIPDMVKIMLDHGTDPNFLSIDGSTILCTHIKNEQIVESLLRSGADPNLTGRGGFTPLSLALNRNRKRETRPSINIIEQLLAFGADLCNELYLCPPERRPDDHDSPAKASFYDSRNIDPDILDALKRVKACGVLISLKRMCRLKIRSCLNPQADERIRTLECVPEALKKFLVMENEQSLLGLQ